MADRLLVPYDLRDQLRLLRWLFLHPRRFSDYTHNSVQEVMFHDLCSVLLPEGSTPTFLIVIQKFSVGVTATRTYKDNFARELDKAFRVDDSRLPERIMMRYQGGALGLATEQATMLTPAAYKLIPYRRKLDAQVQRVAGWMGTTLALIPALLMTFTAAPPDVRLWLGMAVAYSGMWWSFGLMYQKEQYARETWRDSLREIVAFCSAVAGLGFLALSIYATAIESHACLLLYAAMLGLVYGVCANLPVPYPAALVRWQIAVASTSVLLGFHASGGQVIAGLPLLAVMAVMALLSYRTLRRTLALARSLPLSRLLWVVFIAGYGLLAMCVLIRLVTE